MSRPKIAIVGALRLTDEEDLEFSIPMGEPPKTVWFEAMEIIEWPPNFPVGPKIESFQHVPGPQRSGAFKAAKEQCERDRETYYRSVHSDPKYKQAVREFLDRQTQEPKPLVESGLVWAYRGKVVRVDTKQPQDAREKDKEAVLIKHHVLQTDKHYEKVR